MPHAQTMPPPGFQALILCGPGVSLNTFTSSPEEFPKALIPMANRPMVWYPLDWCYRMGVNNITLITPPSCHSALSTALSQNPHLTSLPAPSASILSPSSLTLTTGTSELLRLPEVLSAIRGDFIVLPCDLICDVPGESLLQSWMITQGGLGVATDGGEDVMDVQIGPERMRGTGGERGGRRGGLGVWYETRGREESVKDEETDFVAVAPLDDEEAPVIPSADPSSIKTRLQKLVYATPTDSLKDLMEEKKGFLVRHRLVRKHARVKMLTTFRDAHIYFFPYWVKDMAKRNETFESISEDLVGWWAKAEWQGSGLGEKLGLREVFEGEKKQHGGMSPILDDLEDEIDLGAMSTTRSNGRQKNGIEKGKRFASRVQDPTLRDGTIKSKLIIPPMLAYIHPTQSSAPLIRRVDNAALLLSVSLRLAKVDSIEEVGRPASSPFAHVQKIAYPAGIAQRCTVTKADCLLAENVTVEEKCVVKESVIGANCQIGNGSRLTRCLLMDGAVIGEKCQLTGCIVGRRSKIGRESVLKECEVQDGNVVPDETDAKNEKFMVFERLEDDEDGFGDDGVQEPGEGDIEL